MKSISKESKIIFGLALLIGLITASFIYTNSWEYKISSMPSSRVRVVRTMSCTDIDFPCFTFFEAHRNFIRPKVSGKPSNKHTLANSNIPTHSAGDSSNSLYNEIIKPALLSFPKNDHTNYSMCDKLKSFELSNEYPAGTLLVSCNQPDLFSIPTG